MNTARRSTCGVATRYKTYDEKVRPSGGSTYFIDHTAYIYLLDH